VAKGAVKLGPRGKAVVTPQSVDLWPATYVVAVALGGLLLWIGLVVVEVELKVVGQNKEGGSP
jgi:hypothetical protein